VFAIWGARVAVVFLCVYPATNWLAAQQTRHYVFFFDAELRIPFCPEWIWAYFSVYVLLLLPLFLLDVARFQRLCKALIAGIILAGIFFILFPAPIGFTRVLPEAEPYRTLFLPVILVDAPFNTVPSLHVSCATGIVLMLAENSVSLWRRGAWFFWLGMIAVSTVLVHQHHVLDVVSGLAMAFCLHRWFKPSTPLPAERAAHRVPDMADVESPPHKDRCGTAPDESGG
jgi:membrane-associated phospholipid phosphatase